MLHDFPRVWWHREIDAGGVEMDLVLATDAVLAPPEVNRYPRDEHPIGVARIMDQPDAPTDVGSAPQHVVGLQLGTRDG